MKKAYQLLAILVMSAFLLVGCEGLVQTSFRKLETVATEESAWQFYHALQNSNATMTADLLAMQDKSADSYKELFEVFDNKQNIDRILRDSVVVLDMFYERQEDALFMFDDLVEYTAVKDEGIARNGYRITYGELLDWHQVIGGDSDVDNLIAKLIMPLTVTATISTNVSGSGSDIQSGYTVDIVQTSAFPANASDLESLVPADKTDTSGRHIAYSYTQSQTSTVFTATAGKVVTDAQDAVVSSYSREIKIEKKSNVNYLTSTVTFADGTKSAKTFRLDQQIRNITFGFDKQVGLLQWSLNYNGSGQLMVFGEAYFQGRNKYFVKEQYKVISATPAPYSITKSYTTELAIDGAIYKWKYLPGESLYKHIYEEDVNILKFGIYNNDPVAITMQKIASNAVIQAYN